MMHVSVRLSKAPILSLDLVVAGLELVLRGVDLAAPFPVERSIVEAGNSQDPLREQNILGEQFYTHETISLYDLVSRNWLEVRAEIARRPFHAVAHRDSDVAKLIE